MIRDISSRYRQGKDHFTSFGVNWRNKPYANSTKNESDYGGEELISKLGGVTEINSLYTWLVTQPQTKLDEKTINESSSSTIYNYTDKEIQRNAIVQQEGNKVTKIAFVCIEEDGPRIEKMLNTRMVKILKDEKGTLYSDKEENFFIRINYIDTFFTYVIVGK